MIDSSVQNIFPMKIVWFQTAFSTTLLLQFMYLHCLKASSFKMKPYKAYLTATFSSWRVFLKITAERW